MLLAFAAFLVTAMIVKDTVMVLMMLLMMVMIMVSIKNVIIIRHSVMMATMIVNAIIESLL